VGSRGASWGGVATTLEITTSTQMLPAQYMLPAVHCQLQTRIANAVQMQCGWGSPRAAHPPVVVVQQADRPLGSQGQHATMHDPAIDEMEGGVSTNLESLPPHIWPRLHQMRPDGIRGRQRIHGACRQAGSQTPQHPPVQSCICEHPYHCVCPLQASSEAAGQARQADEAGWGPGKRLESRKLAGAQPAGGSRLPWQPRHQHASAMLESQAKPCLVARGQQDGLGAWQEVRAVRAAVCGSGWAGAGVINLGRWRSSLNPPRDSILCLLHRDPPFKKASSSSVACVHAFSSSVLPAPSTPLGSSPGVMGAESWLADMEIAKLH
jgi:hypothetical protein